MKTTIVTLSVSLLAAALLPGCCDSSIGSCADVPGAVADAAPEAASAHPDAS